MDKTWQIFSKLFFFSRAVPAMFKVADQFLSVLVKR